MSDVALSKWVCREVLLRRESILDLHGSTLATDKTKIKKAWDEIGTLAMIRFGSHVKLDDLKKLWSRDGDEFIENLNENEEAGSPSSSASRTDHGPPEVRVKVEFPEEDDDYIPQKRRKTGPSEISQRNPPPCHAYKVIVREVLKRSSLLIDKSNSKSRTPQANHARWTAWQEIRGVVNHECQRDMPVEQIQIIWRHQKQKIPSELVEDAVANPCVIDDKAVDAIFKYYDEKEKWKAELGTTQDITLTLKDILPRVDINLGRDRELYEDEMKPPPPLHVQTPRILKDLLMPPAADIKPTISPPAEPDPSPVVRNSIEDSIAAVVRNSTVDDRRTALIDNLIKAKTAYLEQTMKLQKKQIEVMDNFNRTVQMLLEER